MSCATIDDGGSAFPHGEIVQELRDDRGVFTGSRVCQQQPGMSLRDWFAGQALASMTAAPDYTKGPCNHAMAERAYIIADAMIAARKGGAK